ncbi:ABC transporter substrate-binding protein [Pengzhenrongella phosphoraccumulans]|uniref:ABC transporter substrate-binding protein n=1 Tax=Pengzhenrongella phosphoraccumulans TaxID=3114394 RepID=UPI00388DBACE
MSPTAGVMLAFAVLSGCGAVVPLAGSAAAESAGPLPSPAPSDAQPTIRVASLKGPTTMGLVHLMDDAEKGRGEQDYEVTVYGTPDEVVPKMLRGTIDIALIPANLASVLYARSLGADGSQIEVAAINTLGMLEVLETGDTVQSMADLKGQTIYSTGKGASPEYVLNYLLERNGLDPATDVTVEFKSEATEVAALLAATPNAIAVLPQPYATVVRTQNPTVRTALSLTDEWAKVTPDSPPVTGVVVVRTDFARTRPDDLDTFLREYRSSTEFTNAHPAQAGVLIADAGIVPGAAIAAAAIPSCHITYIEGAELQTVLSGYLQVLFEADPASVGGSMPGDDFYYRP